MLISSLEICVTDFLKTFSHPCYYVDLNILVKEKQSQVEIMRSHSLFMFEERAFGELIKHF